MYMCFIHEAPYLRALAIAESSSWTCLCCALAACSCVQHWHLHDLTCTEEENPHGAHLAAQKMYNVWDVAAKAIEINGATGENLELKQHRTSAEKARADIRNRIAQEQAEAAAKLTPTNAVEKLCKNAGVAPWAKLTKTNVQEKFGIDWTELEGLGVPFENKPNPKNPRFKPMRLYKAQDVAKALAQKQQRAEESRQRSHARAQEILQARRAGRAAAAAIQNAAP